MHGSTGAADVLVSPAWDDARAAAYRAGVALPVESVDIRQADRRTLAGDLTACTDLPAFTSSAMDGWAVSGHGPWRVVGELRAGGLLPDPLTDGQAVEIATGAEVPVGTTAVLRRENGVFSHGWLAGRVSAGLDLRPQGEEAASGSVLVPAGTVLTPAQLGLAAAAGLDELSVTRRPTARLLVFGDELLTRGLSGAGRVRDSLGPQLPAWLARLGVRCVGVRHVEDSLSAHVAALADASDVDLVVTTGGTAAGPVDHLDRAIASLGGDLVVDSVAVRPGHPMLLARLGRGRWLLGLPGNPQAAVAAQMTLGGPLIDALSGRPMAPLRESVLSADVAAPVRGTRMVSAMVDHRDAKPVGPAGSGMLLGLSRANGYLLVHPGGGAAGSRVRWLPLPC
jgi:molybdopterin molybdotransferase